MEERKEPPTAEKSLNNISWHLKTLVEEIRKLREDLAKYVPGSDSGF